MLTKSEVQILEEAKKAMPSKVKELVKKYSPVDVWALFLTETYEEANERIDATMRNVIADLQAVK